MEDLTGKQLGPYRIVGPLGEGGMAAVYKAYQAAMDRYVALKVLPRHFANDPQFAARFQQEARVIAKLQHPHILPVHDFGEAEGYTYLVMPHVAGGTLTTLLQTGEPLPLPQLRRLMTHIGEALDYAHAQGVIHRDIKPSNILLDERGNCLLTDFGLAKMVEGAPNLTTSGALVGTPAYMSPEQGLGQKVDARSDIYALGVILYEMATGRVPFFAETPIAVVIKHIHDPLPPPRTVNPALPAALERVILKALAKAPEDRFATAGELVAALQTALPESGSTPPPLVPGAKPTTDSTPPPPTVIHPTTETPPPAAPPTGPSLLLLGVLSGLGWGAALLAGFLLSFQHPIVGGSVVGGLGGAVLLLNARQIGLSMSRGTSAWLLLVWMVAGGFTLANGLWLLPAMAVAGWLSGVQLLRTPLFHHRAFVIGLGWVGAWLAGGVLILLGAAVSGPTLRAVLVLMGVMLAGALGNGWTFGWLRRAQRQALKFLPDTRRSWAIVLFVPLLCVSSSCLTLLMSLDNTPNFLPPTATLTAAPTATATRRPLLTPTSTPTPILLPFAPAQSWDFTDCQAQTGFKLLGGANTSLFDAGRSYGGPWTGTGCNVQIEDTGPGLGATFVITDVPVGRWELLLVHLSSSPDDVTPGYSPIRITLNDQTVWEGSPAKGTPWTIEALDISPNVRTGENMLLWELQPGWQTPYWLHAFGLRRQP